MILKNINHNVFDSNKKSPSRKVVGFFYDILSDCKDFLKSCVAPFTDIYKDIRDAHVEQRKKIFHEHVARQILQPKKRRTSFIATIKHRFHSLWYNIARLEALHQAPHVSREIIMKELLPTASAEAPLLPLLARSPLAIGFIALGTAIGALAMHKTVRRNVRKNSVKLFDIARTIGRQTREDVASIGRALARLSFPKVTLPQFILPSFTLPRISIPQITLPTLSLSYSTRRRMRSFFSFPRRRESSFSYTPFEELSLFFSNIRFPRIILPTPTLPRLSFSKLNVQHFSLPHLSFPRRRESSSAPIKSGNFNHFFKHKLPKKISFLRKHYVTEFVILGIILGTVGVFMSIYATTTSNRANMPIVYQGRLMDASYIPVADNSTYYFRFKITTGSDGSGCVWATGSCGTPASITAAVSRGLFTTILGTGVGNNTSLSGINFDANTHYLEVTVCGTADSNCQTLSPRKQLGGVTYAYNSDLLDGLNYDAFLQLAPTTNPQTLTFTGIATDGVTITGNSLTTGKALVASSSSLTSGILMDLQVSGTAAAASQTALNILTAGATATNAITTYGAQISNTHTNGTSGTNVALYLNASGATTANYGLIVNAGSVGIGITSPDTKLHIKDTSADTTLTMRNVTNSATGNVIDFRKSRGDGTANGNALNLNDVIGQLDFYYLRGGPAWLNGAQIKSIATDGSDGYTDGNSLIFSTAQNAGALAEYMRITHDGKVGIGTTTPGGTLDVWGTTAVNGIFGSVTSGPVDSLTLRQARGTIASPTQSGGEGPGIRFEAHDDSTTYKPLAIIRASHEGGGVTTTNSYGRLEFYTTPIASVTPTERMRIDSGGNVVIGTTSSSGLFQVTQPTTGVGTVSNSASGTTVTGVGTQFLNTFKVGDTITINGETVAISAIASNTSMTTATITGANSGVAYTLTGGNRFAVLGNGNVGIGTTTPSDTLDVRHNGTNATGLTISAPNNTGAGSQPSLVFKRYTGGSLSTTAYISSGSSGTTVSDLFFATGTVATPNSPSTRMVINNIGNVGIGMSTKLSRLAVMPAADASDIGGTTTANATTTITGSSTTFTTSLGIGDRISLSSAASTYATVTAIASDTSLTVDSVLGDGSSQTINVKRSIVRFEDASNAVKLVVNDQGNVGIGTTSPGQKLEIVGDMRLGYGGDPSNDYARSLWFSVDATPVDVAGIRMKEHSTDVYGLEFQTRTGGSTTTKMTVLGGGDVGIGMTPSNYKLDITGTASYDVMRLTRTNGGVTTKRGIVLDSVNDASSNYAGIDFNTGGTKQGHIIQETTGNIYFDSRADLYLRPGSIDSTAGSLILAQPTIDNQILNIITTATGDDPNYKVYQGRGTTTTTNTTDLNTIAITQSNTFVIEARVIGRATSTAGNCTLNDGATYIIRGGYNNASGTAAALDGTTPQAEFTSKTFSGTSATLVLSSGNVIVRATGDTNCTITWHSTVSVSNVGS